MSHDLSISISERKLASNYYYSANLLDLKNNSIELNTIQSSSIIKQNKYIEFKASKNHSFHSFRMIFKKSIEMNGLSLRYRLNNWERIQYMAVGFNVNSEYFHIKISHPLEGNWSTFSFSIMDLCSKIQNKFSDLPDKLVVDDLCVKIKGEPKEGGAIFDILKFSLWHEPIETRNNWISIVEHKKINNNLIEKIHSYQTKSLKNSTEVCKSYFENGTCPIVKSVDWEDKSKKPKILQEVNTYRYSWHALHHVANMIIFGNSQNSKKIIDVARVFAKNWINLSWDNTEEDQKFMWYDHGVAERQLSLIMLYHEANVNNFKEEFIDKLKQIILLQGRLLESEVFYASHQTDKYHNHAMFQDLALLITALSFRNESFSNRWIKQGLSRLEEQVSILLEAENGYAVFKENSIGYHGGVIRILKLASEIISIFNSDSAIHEIYHGMLKFSDLLTYPDGRSPAQGDTMRISNEKNITRFCSATENKKVCLEKSGYGIIKGHHDLRSFMFCFFATALSKTHKHEDNLSFTLFFDMIEWLIDPSYYSHEYDEKITAFLRSDIAHNTISIPNHIHSIEINKCSLSSNFFEDKFRFISSSIAHEGFEINRIVEGSEKELNITFKDHVKTKLKGLHSANMTLMCGEFVDVIQNDDKVFLSSKNSKYQLEITLPTPKVSLFNGEIGEKVRGISGLGFLEKSNVNMILCEIPINEEIQWNIKAILRDD